jgi:DNA mismatch endonuclease (patch repair protein)
MRIVVEETIELGSVPSEVRSRIMRSVGQRDTAPEIKVRRLLYKMGYRFRLNRTDLPGKPDIVMPGRRIAIFVHGCFWHRHPQCPRASMPASNRSFWEKKFQRNRERDLENVKELIELGWRVLVVWECSTRDKDRTLATSLSASINQLSDEESGSSYGEIP